MKQLIFLFHILCLVNISVAQTDTLGTGEYKIFYYPNGKIASEGILKNEKPEGLWKSYYVTGIKKSEGVWKNNKLDSVWIFLNQMGDTTEKINYLLGKKNGYYFKYYTGFDHENTVRSKELYINDERNGKAVKYYENGAILNEIPYRHDAKHGIALEYNKEGKIITVTRYRKNEIVVREEINRLDKEGRKTGKWQEFYDNGNIKEERNYSEGKLDGYVKRYNEDGKLVTAIKYNYGIVDLDENDFETGIEIKEKYDDNDNLIFQGSYRKEIPIGVHRYFNKDGKVTESKTYNVNGKLIAEGIVLLNGLEDGNWTYYYQNGNKRATGSYNYGKKTRQWTYYYPNGKVQQKGSYTNGKLSGIWRWYYDTGELLKEEYYIYGNLDGECVEYSVLGEIITKGSYIEGYKEGEWIYIIGDQKHIGKYVMGEKNGTWKSFYIEENKKSFTGDYIQGNLDGKHLYFYPNGELKEERYYEEGQKVRSWSKYNENGELILVVKYKDGILYKINGEKVQLDQMQ
ncbi:MAG: hypothetical protein KQH79_15850 [Bacteroidetes bacterium]|nr:hypothetical protein [Bacteroidota bacterium]